MGYLDGNKDDKFEREKKDMKRYIKADGLGILTSGRYPCMVCGSYDKVYPIDTVYICPSCFRKAYLSPLVKWYAKPLLVSRQIYCPICGKRPMWVYRIDHAFVCMNCLKKMGRNQYKWNTGQI